MRITCLHTAAPLGLTLAHHVAPEPLAEAEADGLTPALRARTSAMLQALRQEADAVILTCSTLGLAAHGAGIVRANAALAHAARHAAGPVVVLCAAETTLDSTAALFGPDADIRLVPGAWALFRTGGATLDAIAAAADAAQDAGAATVALAQVSMTGAAILCRRARPLTSPGAALRAVLGR